MGFPRSLWAWRSRICPGNAIPGNDLGKCRFDRAAPGADLLLATTARFDSTKAHRNLPSDYPRRANARRATVWHGSAHRLQAHLPMPTVADGPGSARPPAEPYGLKIAPAAFGPTLPTWALQQVGSYMGYIGHAADLVVT